MLLKISQSKNEVHVTCDTCKIQEIVPPIQALRSLELGYHICKVCVEKLRDDFGLNEVAKVVNEVQTPC